MSMDVLICGFGNVGRHVKQELTSDKIDIFVYDKYKLQNESVLGRHYDVAFVCVPTESLPDGRCNTSEVLDIVPRIDAGAIVIKSAVPVGTCDSMGDNVLVSPEYYGTTQHSLDMPNFLVLGGDRTAADKVVALYAMVKPGSFHFVFCGRRTAELCKYMENCWIATKVTFCNEFAEIARRCGVPYGELREAWLADERVSPSHTFAYPDQPYYDSHCLNKDIPALIADCAVKKIDAPLMWAVHTINTIKKRQDD